MSDRMVVKQAVHEVAFMLKNRWSVGTKQHIDRWVPAITDLLGYVGDLEEKVDELEAAIMCMENGTP